MKKLLWIFSAAAYLLITIVFIRQLHGTPVGYAAYLLSAAALAGDMIVLLPRLFRFVRSLIMKTGTGERFLTDFAFKERVLLFMSFGVNAAYALMNLVNGIVSQSAWAITFAVYYLAIGSMRILLFRSLRLDGLGKELENEYRRYYRCGIAIMLMAIPFAGIVTLMVKDDLGYHYAQIVIYAMAAYVFYSVISCVINIIRYRKYNSPVLSAVKRISFISALVSLIGLQTAMLEQFNSDEAFRVVMVSRTGIVILVIIFAVGLEMTVLGKIKIRFRKKP